MISLKINRDRRVKWYLALLLFFGIIIDSALPAIFPTAFLGSGQTIISHVTLYVLVLFAFYFRDGSILFNAFVFGLIADSYNTTILGLYATLYLLVALFVIKVKKYLPKKSLVQILLFLLTVAFVDFSIFVFYRETGHTTMALTPFLANNLGPTMLYNIVLTFILYFPSRGLLNLLGFENYLIF